MAQVMPQVSKYMKVNKTTHANTHTHKHTHTHTHSLTHTHTHTLIMYTIIFSVNIFSKKQKFNFFLFFHLIRRYKHTVQYTTEVFLKLIMEKVDSMQPIIKYLSTVFAKHLPINNIVKSGLVDTHLSNTSSYTLSSRTPYIC